MWIPNCCNANDNSSSKMKHTVKLYYRKLSTAITSGVQNNEYNQTLVLTKRCYIKDRSIASQDSAIVNGIKNTDTSKEFIFKYFDISDYQFNELLWAGVRLKVLGMTKLSSVNMDGKKYNATDAQPFISILAGVKQL